MVTVTFVKWPSCEHIPSVSKARPPGTQAVVLLGARSGALLTLGAPGCPHRTAARVHAELPRDRMDTFILIPLQVTLLHADIYVERDISV